MAPASMLRTLQDVLAIAKGGGVVLPVRTGTHKAQGRICKTAGQVLANARWAADQEGGQGVLLRTGDGAFHELSGEVLDALDPMVPTQGRQDPLVAFVGAAPSALDAARGQPLSGMDGECFRRAYLEPLGLGPDEVVVTNLLPHAGTVTPELAKRYVGFAKAELSAYAPKMVVALGKAAREELGAMAQECLPHPAVTRKQGDNGELGRKLKRLRAEVDKLRKGQLRKVHIAKFTAANADLPAVAPVEKQIVYGVVIDPYQYDSQGDHISPAECQQTAHDWLVNNRIIGLMHEAQLVDAFPVESWLWPYPSPEDYQNAMLNQPHSAFESTFGTDQVHSGAWVLGTRIDDPAAWAAVCAGELDAYSIGGEGTRTMIDGDPALALPQVTFVKS